MEDSQIPAASAANPRKKHTAAGYAVSFFVKLGVTALIVWGLLTLVWGVHICHANSAYPALHDGDLCITSRLTPPKSGDLIVYSIDGEPRFGRVIGLAGDKVEITPNFVAVNDYGIVDHTVYATPAGSALSYPYYVPQDCVFVLNDYRSDCSDSRSLGGIPLADVEGPAVFIMRMRGI